MFRYQLVSNYPSAGEITFNNRKLNLATQITISRQDVNGNSIDGIIRAIAPPFKFTTEGTEFYAPYFVFDVSAVTIESNFTILDVTIADYFDNNLPTTSLQISFVVEGGAGATTLSSLTDVSIPAPTSGQVLTYTGSNWESVDIPAPTTLTASAGVERIGDDFRANLQAGGGLVIDTDEIKIDAPLNQLNDVNVPAPANGEVLTFTGANWESVSLLPKAPANSTYSNRYEWTTNVIPTSGQMTSLTLSPDTYTEPTAGATHIRIHESDLNGAKWLYPNLGGSGYISWQCARVPVDANPLPTADAIGFVFPEGHTTTLVSGYYTINIQETQQFASPLAGNQYNLSAGVYGTYLTNIRGKAFNNLPFATFNISPTSIPIGVSDPFSVPYTGAFFGGGSGGFSTTAGEITFVPDIEIAYQVVLTLDVRMYGNVQDVRLFANLEFDSGSGFAFIGQKALSYSKNSISLAETQSSTTTQLQMVTGDKLRIVFRREDNSPATQVTNITIEECSLSISVCQVVS